MFLGPETYHFLAIDDQVLGALSERMPLFHPSLIEFKSGIRGSLGTLGPREIKKKVFVGAQSCGHQRVHWPSLRHIGA